MRLILIWMCIGAVLKAVPAFATPPPLPPQSYDVRSENGACKAHADAENGRITAYRLDPNGGTPIWTLDAFASAMSISDDCQSLVTSIGGHEFLFLGKSLPSSDVLVLYRRGRWVRTIVLGDVYPDVDKVARQYRGAFWSDQLAWVEGRIAIHTVDGRTVSFDPATGQRVD